MEINEPLVSHKLERETAVLKFQLDSLTRRIMILETRLMDIESLIVNLCESDPLLRKEIIYALFNTELRKVDLAIDLYQKHAQRCFNIGAPAEITSDKLNLLNRCRKYQSELYIERELGFFNRWIEQRQHLRENHILDAVTSFAAYLMDPNETEEKEEPGIGEIFILKNTNQE